MSALFNEPYEATYQTGWDADQRPLIEEAVWLGVDGEEALIVREDGHPQWVDLASVRIKQHWDPELEDWVDEPGTAAIADT